jgi:D-tyrosyl-tRNA(Tyr) deacylase
MRAVVQRVDFVKVSVAGRMVSAIERGLLAYVGVEKGDVEADSDYLLEKIIHLRIFEDTNGKMNQSLIEIQGELLAVSQFTLLADCRKGRRPSFTDAEEPQKARILYEFFLMQARQRGVRIQSGEFQALMKIESINDGPVTMIIDSKKSFKK